MPREATRKQPFLEERAPVSVAAGCQVDRCQSLSATVVGELHQAVHGFGHDDR